VQASQARVSRKEINIQVNWYSFCVLPEKFHNPCDLHIQLLFRRSLGFKSVGLCRPSSIKYSRLSSLRSLLEEVLSRITDGWSLVVAVDHIGQKTNGGYISNSLSDFANFFKVTDWMRASGSSRLLFVLLGPGDGVTYSKKETWENCTIPLDAQGLISTDFNWMHGLSLSLRFVTREWSHAWKAYAQKFWYLYFSTPSKLTYEKTLLRKQENGRIMRLNPFLWKPIRKQQDRSMLHGTNKQSSK